MTYQGESCTMYPVTTEMRPDIRSILPLANDAPVVRAHIATSPTNVQRGVVLAWTGEDWVTWEVSRAKGESKFHAFTGHYHLLDADAARADFDARVEQYKRSGL